MRHQSYDRVSIWLHWLVATAVITQFATGWVWGIYERGSDPRMVLFRIHIVVGSIILALALVRVVWRLTHKAPPLPQGMSRATQIASKATHGLLYLAILVQPALGLLAITAFGKSLGRWPRDFHMVLVNVIAAIIVLHVAAAIWHQFIRRDGLIRRMLPARS
jgi:cytochrome b561